MKKIITPGDVYRYLSDQVTAGNVKKIVLDGLIDEDDYPLTPEDVGKLANGIKSSRVRQIAHSMGIKHAVKTRSGSWRFKRIAVDFINKNRYSRKK